jgi:hypothetical protein
MLHDRHEGIDKAFISSTEHSLDDSPTKQQLLEEYNFLSVSANSSNDAVDKVLHFANDIGFLVSIASGWPRTAYVFHFNKPNPWSGEKRQKFVKSKKSADYGRRSTIFKWAETSSLEKLSDAWGVFLRGE